MLKVSINSRQKALTINHRYLRALIRSVLIGEGLEHADVSVALVDDPAIHELNYRYLGHDEPTDVLSFPLGEPGSDLLAGELIISAEKALVESAKRGHSAESELALYVIHGLLHLCGYDDTTPAAARTMRGRESYYLSLLGLPNIAPD